MRDIKFRAWDKETNTMLSWRELTWNQIGFVHSLNGEGNWIPMQHTGLKDKNGKEIYESDIVHWTGDSETDYWNETDKVEWIENSTGFYPFIKNAQWRTDIRTVEVIGNIYENPELMKG